MKLLLLSFFLIGCSHHEKTVNIATPFQSIYEKFLSDAKINGHPLSINDLIIQYGKIPDADGIEVYGDCHQSTNETPTVTINDAPDVLAYIDAQGPVFMEVLLYHELGHCLLERGHDLASVEMDDGNMIYASIMYLHPLDGTIYFHYRDYYVLELFNPGQVNRP